jgi:hypothetical protein
MTSGIRDFTAPCYTLERFPKYIEYLRRRRNLELIESSETDEPPTLKELESLMCLANADDNNNRNRTEALQNFQSCHYREFFWWSIRQAARNGHNRLYVKFLFPLSQEEHVLLEKTTKETESKIGIGWCDLDLTQVRVDWWPSVKEGE